MATSVSGNRYNWITAYNTARRFYHSLVYFRPKRRNWSTRLFYTFTLFIGFVYLNYKFNLPVFHVFRNKNVHTPCLLPTFDIYDSSVQQFFWKQQHLPCEDWLDLFYVDLHGNLTMNKTAVNVSGFLNLKCKYRYVQRISETEITFTTRVPYVEPTYMESDFIHVECFDDQGKLIYNDLHINIETKRLYKTRQLVNESWSELSVYIIGVDSLSRLIAERKLKKTLDYLRTDLSAYLLNGYTRIGDSTYPNIGPMLTGLKPLVEDGIGMNDLPFIFKNFSKRGSVDLYAEDWYIHAAIKGFIQQPAYHYVQPLMQAMDIIRPSYLPLEVSLKFLQNHNIPLRKTSALCFGNSYRYKIMLQYYKRFIEVYGNKRKFGFFWTNEVAHDFLNMAEFADDDFYEFFKWMKDTNKLENSVVIFMGDHGPRYSEIQNTDIGRISNLLPMMAIVMPDHIKTKFRHIHNNLKLNTQRLSTPYDVFEMLKNILNGDFEEKAVGDYHKTIPRGISLFQEIPASRSCADAAISEHFCPCYSSRPVLVDDYRVVDSVTASVVKINEILKDDKKKCAKVVLSSIHSASFIYADMERDSVKERSVSLRSFLWTIKERTRLRVTFRTNPGNAVFEATLEYVDKNNIQISGDITRINRYGNQSACIDDVKLQEKIKRSYCYCI